MKSTGEIIVFEDCPSPKGGLGLVSRIRSSSLDKPRKVPYSLRGFFYCAADSFRERLAQVAGTTKAKQDFCDVSHTVAFLRKKNGSQRLPRNGKGKVREFTLPVIQ